MLLHNADDFFFLFLKVKSLYTHIVFFYKNVPDDNCS